MTEATRTQIERMKDQTFGVEVEMNSITREKAAETAAEYFGTGTYRFTGGSYSAWEATDAQGRTWSFQRDSSILGLKRKNARWSARFYGMKTWSCCKG